MRASGRLEAPADIHEPGLCRGRGRPDRACYFVEILARPHPAVRSISRRRFRGTVNLRQSGKFPINRTPNEIEWVIAKTLLHPIVFRYI